MSDIRIIKAYSQALYEIGEKNKINIMSELTALQEAINNCPDLETLLFLDVFTVGEKSAVIKGLLEKMQASVYLRSFLFFLLEQRRINMFPQIYAAIVKIDDAKNGFIKGIIESSQDEISESVKNKIKKMLSEKIGKEVKLTEKKNEKITAGYRVTVGDLQLDASLENQLEQLKSNILNADS